MWSHPTIVTWFARYSRSSIGVKQTMAVTGLFLVLFALVHMLGHLQMFGGRDMYNSYAHFLQELWEVKWPVRAGLFAFIVIHLVAGITVSARNKAARPVGYAKFTPVVTSTAARTMIWTGLFVFVFLTFHILHFTLGQVQPEHVPPPRRDSRALQRWDAYGMYVAGFQNVAIYVIYLVGIALLCAAPRSRRVVVVADARLASSEVSDRQDRPRGRLGVVRRLHDPADRGARRSDQVKLESRSPTGPIEARVVDARSST